MNHRTFFWVAPGVLSACMAAAMAQGPTSQPDARPAASQGADAHAEVPWGKEVDGLTCRIVIPKEGAVGLITPITIEIKNVSNRMRYIKDLSIGRPWCPFPGLGDFDYAIMTLGDSKGADLALRPFGKWAVVPEAIRLIAPNEVKSFATAYVFVAPGEYRLKFTFASPKPAKVVLYKNPAYRKNDKGGWEEYEQYTYSGEPTKEQVADAWTSTIESAAAIRVHVLTPENLTVHEWGVFSMFNDAPYANEDLAAEWAALPEYFYRQFPTQRLKGAWATPFKLELIKKPIIYFYTDQPKLDVKVKVAFLRGAPAVWWPAASVPGQAGRFGLTEKPKEIFTSLEWSGVLTDDPAATPSMAERFNGKTTPTPMPSDLAKASWIDQARIKGPAMFTTDAGLKNYNVQASAVLFESERFLYYDGLMPAMDYLRCTDIAADSVSVENSAKFAIANLILVDRRDANAIRFARVEKIDAGGKVKVALKEIPSDWPAGITRTLGQDLRAAGLFDNEADSVLAIWQKGLFDRPGITAIYLLPQAEYDRMLPLTVSPPPGKVVRVGIVLHGQLELTPTILAARLKELLAAMDSDDYRVRDKAAADLAAVGPASFAAIRKAMDGKMSPEVKTRLEKILAQDVGNFLKPAPGSTK